MTWVMLDDRFPEHPKAAAAGPLGRDLFTASLAYANRNLTDGFIPDSIVPCLVSFEGVAVRSDETLVETWEPADPRRIAETLVHLEMWEQVDGGFQIHDYLHYQQSREQVTARMEAVKTQRSRSGRQRAATAPRDEQGRFAGSETRRSVQQTPAEHQQPSSPPPPPTPPAPGNSPKGEEITKEGGPGGEIATLRVARRSDPVWEILEELFGPAPRRRRYRAGWGEAAAELREQGATPAAIRDRVLNGRRSRDTAWAVTTVHALAKHWNLPLDEIRQTFARGQPRLADALMVSARSGGGGDGAGPGEDPGVPTPLSVPGA